MLLLVQLWVLQLYVLLQRTLGTVASVAKLRVAVVFSLDLLGSPPGPLAQFPFRFVVPLLILVLGLLVLLTFMKCN